MFEDIGGSFFAGPEFELGGCLADEHFDAADGEAACFACHFEEFGFDGVVDGVEEDGVFAESDGEFGAGRATGGLPLVWGGFGPDPLSIGPPASSLAINSGIAAKSSSLQIRTIANSAKIRPCVLCRIRVTV